MRLSNIGKIGFLLAAAFGVVAADVSTAAADETSTLVYFPGGMSTVPVRVDSAVGGTTTPSRTAGGLSTAAISIPLKISRNSADSVFLRFALVDLVNPVAYGHSAIKVEQYQRKVGDAYALATVSDYRDVTTTRVDLAGTYGNATQKGAFVVTANVGASSSTTPPPRPPAPLPAVHAERPSALPPVWAFTLHDFSNGSKVPPEGYFTFEPISLTSSGSTTPVAITLHGAQVKAQQVLDWAKAHPNDSATLEWRPGSGSAAMASISFKNVNVTSATDTAGAEVHLTALVDSIVVN